MIGTRAHGKYKVYRYYTCFTRSCYDTTRCDGYRINAAVLETAVLDALAELASAEAKIADTGTCRATGHEPGRGRQPHQPRDRFRRRSIAKALIETLIAHIKITGPDRVIPVFRIPQPHTSLAAIHTNKALMRKTANQGHQGKCSCND